MTGRVLGHFEVQDELGAGGMGTVFKAQDLRLGRVVALKVLRGSLFDDPVSRKRFVREAQLAASVVHPNVATVFEINAESESPFIAMELVPGENLKQLLLAGGQDLSTIVRIGKQVAEALEIAHDRGIVHRDVKSSNIMITPQGQVKVLDFGLAKAIKESGSEIALRDETLSSEGDTEAGTGESITRRGTALGTLDYMSPEQAMGRDVDPRSDLFSLGVVLYEACCRHLPFKGKTDRAVLHAIRAEEPQPLHSARRDVPPELSRIVTKCLSKDPGARYQTAGALAADLARVERRLLETDSRTARRRHATWPALASLAVVLALASYWAATRDTPLFGERARRLMVACFENRTDDSDFDGTVEEVLAAGLDQSQEFKVTPQEQLDVWLSGMGIRAKPKVLDVPTAIEACRRGGVPVLLTGSVSSFGSDYLIIARLWNVADGQAVATYQETARDKEEVLPALTRLMIAIRERSGETLPPDEALQAPAEMWTTSSWEALRLYSEARGLYLAGDHVGAIALLERALALDPDFAMAHARLGRIHRTFRDGPRAQEAFGKALEHTNRLTPKEQQLIAAHSALATEQFVRALPDLQQLVAVYPLDPDIHLELGYALMMLGDYPAAEEQFKRVIELSPPAVVLHYNLANLYLHMNDWDRAQQEIDRGAALNKEAPQLDYSRGYRALALGDTEAALSHFETMARASNQLVRNRGILHLALAQALVGQYGRAESTLKERVNFSRSRGQPTAEAETHLILGRLALDRRDAKRVRTEVHRALRFRLDPSALGMAGELLARARFVDDAEGVLTRLEAIPERYPALDRRTNELRGEILMARERTREAVPVLRAARESSPVPVWSEPLARALLTTGDLEGALAQYNEILGRKVDFFMRPGALFGPPLYAEAVLRVGQVEDRRRNREKALESYRAYLSLRAAADSNLPDVLIAKKSALSR